MNIRRADFVAVPSTDWERSRAFYVDTLGLRPDEHAQAEFWAGDQCFGIWEPATFGMEFAPQRNGHIAFQVDDVAAARAELEAKGVEFSGETLDTRRLPHGVLPRPGRQRPDAPPSLRATHGREDRLVITVERSDFVSVPVTDLERSTAFYRTPSASSRSATAAGPSSSSART